MIENTEISDNIPGGSGGGGGGGVRGQQPDIMVAPLKKKHQNCKTWLPGTGKSSKLQ